MKNTILPQFHIQTLSFIRNSRSVFFTLAFPIALALLFGVANKDTSLPVSEHATVPFRTWSALGLTAYVFLMGGFVKVAGDIAAQRDSGLLKRIRLRGTSDRAVLLGYGLSAFVVALACELVLIASAVAFLGLRMPVDLTGVVLVSVLGVLLCTVVGIAYSSFIPSAESSQMMLLVPSLVLMFLSGIFTPPWVLPSSLRTLSEFFPVGYLAEAMRSMWLGKDFVHQTLHTHGMTVGSHQGLDMLVGPGLLVCAAWLVVAVVVALKFFRWDVRGGK